MKISNNKINVHTDTISSALHKKVGNKNLSKKTLAKLTKIANTQDGFTRLEAKNMFIKNIMVARSDKSMKLIGELRKVITYTSHPRLTRKIAEFIRCCNKNNIVDGKNGRPGFIVHQVRNMNANNHFEDRQERACRAVREIEWQPQNNSRSKVTKF